METPTTLSDWLAHCERLHPKGINGIELGLDRDFWQLPPSDAMLLQRKFGRLYLLAIRLKARVNLHELALTGLVARKRGSPTPA